MTQAIQDTIDKFRASRHPNTRWRSRRRRSNEMSARKIRQETPPYWQLHTEGGPGTDMDPHHAPGRRLWAIHRIKMGFTLMVNGRPRDLPAVIDLDRDTVTLKSEPLETVPTRMERSTGKRRLSSPPGWLRKGVRADYHAVIGGPITHHDRLVLFDPFLVKGNVWCTCLEGVRGWVAVEALSKSG